MWRLVWSSKFQFDLRFHKIKARSTNCHFWNYCSRFRFSWNSSAKLLIRHTPLSALVSFKYQLSNELSYNFILCLVFQSIQCNNLGITKKRRDGHLTKNNLHQKSRFWPYCANRRTLIHVQFYEKLFLKFYAATIIILEP
jgi:hypothetical protein